MSYKWILFDADNTLFDFDRSAADALRRTIEAHGHSFEPRHATLYYEINARYWHALERGEIDQDGLRVARFAEFLQELDLHAIDAVGFSAAYETKLSETAYLLEGAEEILETLAPHACLALITNGLLEVQRPRLLGSPIAPYFQEILISAEVGAAKPDPEIFAIAFTRMGAPDRSEVLIVGDSLSSDIQGGSDFGIDTCWFNPAGTACDRDVTITYEIRSLAELAPICLDRAPNPGRRSRRHRIRR